MKPFRQRLQQGEVLLGTLISFPNAEVVELLAKTDFDWLFIDGEHGPFSALQMQGMLQAASPHCPCLIRVASHDVVAIKNALDIGAAGIIVPQINSVEEAAKAIQAAKYPPVGNRGVGLARAHEYGLSFTQYLDHANDETCVVLQAETRGAINNIDDIIALEHVDAILIGPYDLSANLGHTGELEHPEVVDAISKVEYACKEKNVQLGYFGVNAQAVRPYIDRGFTLITAGVDSLFLLNSAQELIQALRNDKLGNENKQENE